MSMAAHIERVVADEQMRVAEFTAHGRLSGQGLLDMYDADHEDADGRLPHEPGYVPPTRKEITVTSIAATHPDTDHVDPDAPWGRKNDGSPRAKPGRKPAACEAPAVERAVRSSAGGGGQAVLERIDALEAEAEEPTPVDRPAILSRFIDETNDRVREVGDEIAERVEAIETLREEIASHEAKVAVLRAERDELADAYERLVKA